MVDTRDLDQFFEIIFVKRERILNFMYYKNNMKRKYSNNDLRTAVKNNLSIALIAMR